MADTPHVVVVTYDNADPTVYGLYDSAFEADLAVPTIRADLARRGVQDHHVESVTPRPLRR